MAACRRRVSKREWQKQIRWCIEVVGRKASAEGMFGVVVVDERQGELERSICGELETV